MSYIGKPLTLVNLISTQISHAAPLAGPSMFELDDNLVFADETLAKRVFERVDMATMTVHHRED